MTALQNQQVLDYLFENYNKLFEKIDNLDKKVKTEFETLNIKIDKLMNEVKPPPT